MNISKRGERLPEARIQMTSMIDIVFLLIIFFMCVTEMSKLEVEAVTLPEAIKARDDTDPPKDRIIVNVMKDGTYRMKGTTYSKAKLQEFLITHATRMTGPDKLSTLSVKIRSDADTPYKHVQQVLVSCMKAKIWKLSFGVAQKHVAPTTSEE